MASLEESVDCGGRAMMTVELTRRGTRGAGFPDMPPWGVKLFHAVNMGLFRLAGRWMRVQGRPLLLLTTVGAKTGQRRRTTLGYFPDAASGKNAAVGARGANGGSGARSGGGESWLVVASAAGAAKHPAWYVNLAKNPGKVTVELGTEQGRVRTVKPESLKGEERERAWREIERLSPGYGKYQEQTDRAIPIVRLRAAEE